MGFWRNLILGGAIFGATAGAPAQAQENTDNQPSAKEKIEMMQKRIAHTQDSILAQAPEASVAEFRTFATKIVENDFGKFNYEEACAGNSKYDEVYSGFEAYLNVNPSMGLNYYPHIEGGVHSKGGDFTIHIGKPGKDGYPEDGEIYNVDDKGVYKEIGEWNEKTQKYDPIYLPPQAQKKVLGHALQQLKEYQKTHSTIDYTQVAMAQKVND